MRNFTLSDDQVRINNDFFAHIKNEIQNKKLSSDEAEYKASCSMAKFMKNLGNIDTGGQGQGQIAPNLWVFSRIFGRAKHILSFQASKQKNFQKQNKTNTTQTQKNHLKNISFLCALTPKATELYIFQTKICPVRLQIKSSSKT